jgi:hypothetical protein
VPAGIAELGLTALAGASVEIALVRNGEVVATTGTDPAFGDGFRTLTIATPQSGNHTIRITNHAAAPADVALSAWVRGDATALVASAAQVSITGKVEVSARTIGAVPATPITRLLVTASDRSGEDQSMYIRESPATACSPARSRTSATVRSCSTSRPTAGRSSAPCRPVWSSPSAATARATTPRSPCRVR